MLFLYIHSGFTYGKIYRDANGKHYNMVGSNGEKFLVQRFYRMPHPGLYAKWECANTAVSWYNSSVNTTPPAMSGLWFEDWVDYVNNAASIGAAAGIIHILLYYILYYIIFYISYCILYIIYITLLYNIYSFICDAIIYITVYMSIYICI